MAFRAHAFMDDEGRKSQARFRLRSRRIVQSALVFMDVHTDNKLQELRQFPYTTPPKAGSRYVRTGRYARGWHKTEVSKQGDRLIITVLNTEKYAVRVGGDETGANQTEMHSNTGWPLVAEFLRDGFTDGIRRAVKNGG